MSTLEDVASRAGVSKMTVSRVINDSGYVSDVTRDRVNEAISVLNYRPNMVAKGLVTKRNNIIAYVTPDISDPFYNMVVKGVENACSDHGYTAIICDAHNEQSVTEHINMLIDRQIDGAIFHHMAISQEQADALNAAGVTCVMIDNELDLDNIYQIESADYVGARMAVEHLLAKGHTKIGCIHGVLSDDDFSESPSYVDTFQRKIWLERTRGYEAVMNERGIRYRRYYPGCGDTRTSYTLGQTAVVTMQQDPDPPTALFCQSDVLALGALSEALEQDIPVPGKIAIIGYDGIDFSMMLYPRVTTVVQPRYDMGQIAVDVLIRATRNESVPRHTTLAPSLFQGDTT